MGLSLGLGWVYLSADREDGMWLWRKEHGWLWSNQETWPFLWSHASGDWIYLLIRAKQDPLFFDYSTRSIRTVKIIEPKLIKDSETSSSWMGF